MEEKKEHLFEIRNYLTCLKEGIKLPTQNFIPLFKFLYPSLIFIAVVAMLGGLFYEQFSMVMARLYTSSVPYTLNVSIVAVGGLVLLSFLAICFYCSQLMLVVRRYNETGQCLTLSFKKEFKEILQVCRRTITVVGLAVVVLALAVWGLSFFVGLTNIWSWVILSVFVLVVFIPYTMVCWEYMYRHEVRFADSLKQIKTGFQYWVAFFIVALCGGLLAGLLSVIAWLPSAVLAYAGHLSALTVCNGDETDLPGSVFILTIIFYVISSLLTYIFAWLKFFPLSFLYGSVVAREKEKAQYKAEQNEEDRLALENKSRLK